MIQTRFISSVTVAVQHQSKVVEAGVIGQGFAAIELDVAQIVGFEMTNARVAIGAKPQHRATGVFAFEAPIVQADITVFDFN